MHRRPMAQVNQTRTLGQLIRRPETTRKTQTATETTGQAMALPHTQMVTPTVKVLLGTTRIPTPQLTPPTIQCCLLAHPSLPPRRGPMMASPQFYPSPSLLSFPRPHHSLAILSQQTPPIAMTTHLHLNHQHPNHQPPEPPTLIPRVNSRT